jgi:hypothetical protein
MGFSCAQVEKLLESLKEVHEDYNFASQSIYNLNQSD